MNSFKLLLLCCLSYCAFGRKNHLRALQSTNINESERPVIYTFFQVKIENHGKSHEIAVDDHLLATWKRLWYEAGWEPRILTLDDARKHPDFEKYRDALASTKLGEGTYNYMCFMRWLAMASHGEGGWMSDYDTLPIGISHLDGLSLPNGGVFTSWERNVPSLLSGSAPEWDRMSKNILDMGVQVLRDEKREFFSDMFALHDVGVINENEFIREMKVFMGYPYKEKHVVDCDGLKNIMAVHLSHALTDIQVRDGLLESPTGEYHESIRPVLADKFYQDWIEQCH